MIIFTVQTQQRKEHIIEITFAPKDLNKIVEQLQAKREEALQKQSNTDDKKEGFLLGLSTGLQFAIGSIKDMLTDREEKFYQHEIICNGYVAYKYEEDGKQIVSVIDPYDNYKLVGHYVSFVEAYKKVIWF